jgi:hypothetical protein
MSKDSNMKWAELGFTGTCLISTEKYHSMGFRTIGSFLKTREERRITVPYTWMGTREI